MNKFKCYVLEKKWERYHDLAYKYFDRAERYPVDSKKYSRYYKKYEKYMSKRIDIHDELYGG